MIDKAVSYRPGISKDLTFPKDDPWTKDDWLDFYITLLKFKGRFIQRHLKKGGATNERN